MEINVKEIQELEAKLNHDLNEGSEDDWWFDSEDNFLFTRYTVDKDRFFDIFADKEEVRLYYYVNTTNEYPAVVMPSVKCVFKNLWDTAKFILLWENN